jgi:5-methylcytosine-specific restriction enzyme subunit McrC
VGERGCARGVSVVAVVRTIDLVEGERNCLAADALSTAEAREILSTRIAKLEFPNPLNGGQFVLEPLNVIGLIPLSRRTMVRITPKIPIANLFGMMERVYDLPSLRFDDGLGRVESIDDIYSRLTQMFAQRVLNRVRRGLYASYRVEEETSTVLRGRLDLNSTLRLRASGDVGMHCVRESITVDNEENRILLWALDRIPRLGLPIDEAIALAQSARRALMGSVMLTEMSAAACRGRSYNRLNSDYAALHALARFFLDGMGPGLSDGLHEFLPFRVNVASLFQEYVVACLRSYAPGDYVVTRQYAVPVSGDFAFEFKMDVAIKNAKTGEVVAIVDAKYKRSTKPAAEDLQQVIAYAAHVGAKRAFLAYPIETDFERLNVGPNREWKITALGLPLNQALDGAAERFSEALFSSIAC